MTNIKRDYLQETATAAITEVRKNQPVLHQTDAAVKSVQWIAAAILAHAEQVQASGDQVTTMIDDATSNLTLQIARAIDETGRAADIQEAKLGFFARRRLRKIRARNARPVPGDGVTLAGTGHSDAPGIEAANA